MPTNMTREVNKYLHFVDDDSFVIVMLMRNCLPTKYFFTLPRCSQVIQYNTGSSGRIFYRWKKKYSKPAQTSFWLYIPNRLGGGEEVCACQCSNKTGVKTIYSNIDHLNLDRKPLMLNVGFDFFIFFPIVTAKSVDSMGCI